MTECRPSEELRVDALTVTDIDAVIAIASSLNLSHWSREDYLAELRRDDSILLACREAGQADILGFIVGRRIPGFQSGEDAEIYNIGVANPLQRRGVGSLLMRSFIDEVLNHGIHGIWLDVRKNNIAAIGFYASFGFAASYGRRNFYTNPPEDAVVMQLILK